jgi:dipeptidyl aminopeptidase/acylaminoacyl peptidase
LILRILIAAAAVLAIVCLPGQAGADEHEAASRRAMTHEDLWLMRRLGTPVPSPDGRRAVVAVTEPSYEADETVADLWLIDLTSESSPRRLTATPGAESDPVWSPDGGRIAFGAKRGDDEVSQLFVLDMTRPGEAMQITSLSTGASTPRWSPDGRYLAFESRVYPDTTGDAANAGEKTRREELGYNVSAYEGFPIRQWDRWRDDLQTRLFVQEAKAGAEARDLLADSPLVAESGFGGVPALSGESLEAAWAPDGQSLVFSATANLNQAAFAPTYFHLYQVPVSGGPPVQITSSTDWSCHSAKFSPDGSALVCQVEPVNAFAYNLTGLGRFDWPLRPPESSSPDLLTQSFDRSVGEFTFSADGRRIYLTAMDAGRVRLYALAADGGDAISLNPDSGGVYAGPASAGKDLVARWEDSTRPAEVVRIDPRSGQHTRLTDFNVERAAVLDRQPLREFWFESPGGRRIHSFVTLPPGFDESRKYPVITLIHGGPHASSLDSDHIRWSSNLLAAPGYVVIQTDYTGSVGYGLEFSQAIQGDPLKTPAEEINQAMDEAIRRYPFIDADRQAAAGASYGGHLANWLQATTDRYLTLIGHAGLASLEGQWSTSDAIYHREINNGGPPWGDSPVWEAQSPSTYADNFSTPMMLTIGEKDYRVPVNQTIAMWTYLQRKQVPGRLVVFHDANHWIMNGAEARYFWSEVHDWLARYLKEPESGPAAGSNRASQ